MSYEIDSHHARTLAQIIDQSSHWQLHPEKKPPFKNVEQANEYIDTHNEPLCIRVPVSGTDDHQTVRVTSSGEDVVLTTISFEDPAESRVHSSHLKIIASIVSDMLNDKLPDGVKVVPF